MPEAEPRVTPIQDRLAEWARWQSDDAGVGYPTRVGFDRLRGSTVPSARITDEEAAAVDAAVGRLRLRCPDQAQVLVEFYLHRRSLSAIARRTRCDRRAVSGLLRAAENAVDWILHLTSG